MEEKELNNFKDKISKFCISCRYYELENIEEKTVLLKEAIKHLENALEENSLVHYIVNVNIEKVKFTKDYFEKELKFLEKKKNLLEEMLNKKD